MREGFLSAGTNIHFAMRVFCFTLDGKSSYNALLFLFPGWGRGGKGGGSAVETVEPKKKRRKRVASVSLVGLYTG